MKQWFRIRVEVIGQNHTFDLKFRNIDCGYTLYINLLSVIFKNMKSESFDLLKVTLVVHLAYTYEVCYNKIPETG